MIVRSTPSPRLELEVVVRVFRGTTSRCSGKVALALVWLISYIVCWVRSCTDMALYIYQRHTGTYDRLAILEI